MRSGSVLVPRSTSHASIGPRIAPCGVLHEFQPLDVVVAHRDRDAADAVAVAVQELRRAVDHDVGAELDRPLDVRAGEVLSTTTKTPRSCASWQAAARSVSRSTGLVGVSRNSICVDGRNARSRRVEIRGVHVGEVELIFPQHPLEQPVGAAVGVVGDDDVIAGLQQRHDGALAAMPEANANAALPPSMAARLPSSALRVGFCVRAYSKPLCSPERVLHVGGGLINRGDDGASGRVGLLARVDAQRAESRVISKFHDEYRVPLEFEAVASTSARRDRPQLGHDLVQRSHARSSASSIKLDRVRADVAFPGARPLAVADTIADVLIVIAALTIGYYLFVDLKRLVLWRVRRRLTLSYIFIGFVPAC